MTNTYSAKPFISYDGEDEKGIRAEVKVVTGYGHIDSIEASEAGKSFKVTFRVDNSKYKSAGWAPDGSNVLEKVRKSQENDEPIYFRIETRRQKGIDREEPINELSTLARAKDSIHKSLAAVRVEGEDEWTISPQAVTRLDEDPVATNGIYSAYNMPKEKVGAPAKQNGYSGLEPPPYVTTLKDGTLNPGSMAVAVPLNLLAFVSEWDKDHPDSQVGEKKRVAVARAMLAAANELQLSIWEDKLDKPDLGAGSHTRARALLFDVIRTYYPLGEDVVDSKESLIEWKNSLVEKSLAMWKWSMTEVESFIK